MRIARDPGQSDSCSLRLVVTTSLSHENSLEATARRVSKRLSIPYVRRKNRSLSDVIGSASGAVVVESGRISLHIGESAFWFHPNMAKIRIMQLTRGQRDRMVEVMGLSPGDTVLDCTCGLASDAIVASFAVGEFGSVHALEISSLLSEIVSIGLSTHEDPLSELVDAMRRVQVFNADYSDFLRKTPDRQYDVVYFDPMFEKTVETSTGLDIVRIFASPAAPADSDIEEAVRVAKRRVVMKDSSFGSRLQELGFKVLRGKRISYGVIDV